MATNLARMSSAGAHDLQSSQAGPWPWVGAAVGFALTGYIFRDSILSTVDTWLTSPEYNYGPLVPVIAGLMLWRDLSRADARPEAGGSGGWLGVAIALAGLLLGFIEFLSHTRFPGQLGLFLTIIGIL